MKSDIVKEKKRGRGRPRNPNKKVYVKTGRPAGRPNSYSDKIAKRILKQLVHGMGRSLTSICRDENMPSLKTVYNWLDKNHPSYQEDFCQRYKICKMFQLDLIYDKIIEIADDERKLVFTKKVKDRHGNVIIKKVEKSLLPRHKLQIQGLKWLASRLQPRKYWMV
jgi:hypothetical protein